MAASAPAPAPVPFRAAFASESEALSQVLDGAAGIPVFGTGVGLIRLVEKAATGARRRHQIKIDDTLRGLDNLTNAELADAVTYLFAEDLRAASDDRSYVLFVDAYEALVPSQARAGRAGASDIWLRDLIAQLDRGLVVVASREPLGWETHDPGWAEAVRRCDVDGLPMHARLELLTECGITNTASRYAIAVASQGLPFYLHLAVDTQTTARHNPIHQLNVVVSSEEILQRFLQHVGANEIRTLELLSIARIFDFGIFQAIADAFDLPRHRMAWESLTAYSFVYPAGPHGRRLHQLMRAALHQRLSEPTIRDVQTLLQNVWHERCEQRQDTEDGVATRARALREAAFCGLHAGTLDGDGLLTYADRALACSGIQAVDGILHDLRDYLNVGTGDADLAATARCLEAETAVVLGDATTAINLAPMIEEDRAGVVGARLTLASAHGRRIAGDTSEALTMFGAVWNTHRGPAQLRAGFWMADLDMCQGRLRYALATTEQILAEAPADNYLLRGDAVRLQHLRHRFALDFDASQQALASAVPARR